ncbi:YIP1 family protein [Tabrizicola sp.]|uniref:YIP1 family protein n=1 Tax=Tabrizicola sp. TaxID=2005166 RepID=UPI0025CE52BF|nr:YIP1 family protein [Tabrizicola sp.]
MTLGARLAGLAQLTLQDPKQAARVLLAEGVPLRARSAGLLLVAILSAITASIQITGREALDPLSAFMLASPIRATIFQWLFLSVSVVLIHRVGRAFGGTGSFADALLIVVWLQVIMLGFQVLQLAVMPLAPAFSGLIGLVSFMIYLWLLTVFIAELHGFVARGLVFLAMVITGVAAGFLLVVLLILLLGPEALMPNV